ncbi:hypothetical protein NA78x_003447 [Anatilimnocola sp. NA78]|uniref:hypothetical protein n=1 Tax=Anatilimnocola sp. NA78 TaxID=3415683 RepID=UPI003CE53D2C
MSRTTATLAVAMVTREHARPEAELVDIVRQYQGLEHREQAIAAISTLKATGWLVETETYGTALVRQAPDLRKQIASKLGDQSIERTLASLRSANDPVIAIVGSMTDDHTYSSYLERLRRAHSEICLAMLATTPKLQAAEIIRERASSGVKIRVLLASTDVVCMLRSNSMAKTSVDSIAGWKDHAKHSPNIEVRISSEPADMRLASCALIDGDVLRLDVYDPKTQRSLQGTLIEVTSGEGRQLNIVSMFKDAFDDAWHRATPSNTSAWLWKLFCEHWQWWFFVLFAIGSFATTSNLVVTAILGSASASFLANAIVTSWPMSISAMRRALKHE